MGGPKLRIVTHLDYNDKLHERFLNILKGLTFQKSNSFFNSIQNILKKIQIIPPSAKKIPKKLQKFNSERVDNYYWLNQRQNPDVLEHLKKENEYYLDNTAHTKKFQEKLFDEIKSKIKEDDESVPFLHNEYWYVTTFEKSKPTTL